MSNTSTVIPLYTTAESLYGSLRMEIIGSSCDEKISLENSKNIEMLANAPQQPKL